MEDGMIECELCEPGRYMDLNAMGATDPSECDMCVVGKWNAEKGSIGSESCTTCEAETTTNSPGAVSKSACQSVSNDGEIVTLAE